MTDAVPIDLSPWFDGDDADRDAVAAAVDEACRTVGFLSVTGHRIPDALVDEMLAVTTSFFDQPMETKLAGRT